MKHDIMISSKGNSKNPDPLDKLFENLDFTPNQNHVIIDIGENLIYCKGGEKVVNEMTGKEIVNLINKLEAEGMNSDKIIEIIKYVELADPKAEATKSST